MAKFKKNMKKIIILSSLAFVGLSCSSNDNEDYTEIVETPTILTKVIVDGDVYNIKYEGNKILEDTSADNEHKFVYTYTGNVITQVKDYYKGSLTITTDFTYDNDKLINVKEVGTTSGSNTPNVRTLTFSYPNSTTINCTKIRNYTFAGNPQVDKSEISYTVNNGEVTSSKEIYYHNNVLAGNIVEAYTYDDKNNPYKNILGFDKIALYNTWIFNDNLSSKRNLIAVSSTNTPVNSTASSYKLSFTNSYNDKGYPTQVKQMQDGTTSSRTTNFVYNQ